MLNDRELLDLGMNTRYVCNDLGRVLHDNAPDASRFADYSALPDRGSQVLRPSPP